MRVNADEYRKFQQKAPDFNDFSFSLFAIEKQQEMKTLEQNCVTLILRHIKRLSFSRWETTLLSSDRINTD